MHAHASFPRPASPELCFCHWGAMGNMAGRVCLSRRRRSMATYRNGQYVCTHACVRACAHVHTCECMHAYTHACTRACVHGRAHTGMAVCSCTRVQVPVGVRGCVLQWHGCPKKRKKIDSTARLEASRIWRQCSVVHRSSMATSRAGM